MREELMRIIAESRDKEWLESMDFDAMEIFLKFYDITRLPATRAEKARRFWAEMEIEIEALCDAIQEELEAEAECPYCHGSGGGYMGHRDPVCMFCHGTGRRVA